MSNTNLYVNGGTVVVTDASGHLIGDPYPGPFSYSSAFSYYEISDMTFVVENGGQAYFSLGLADYLSVIVGTAGYSGYVTVTGAGSVFETNTGIDLGYGGSGVLHVVNGGRVSIGQLDPTFYGITLGHFDGSSASVVVSGAGSQLGTEGGIGVGYSGTASLTVSNGGSMSGAVLEIAQFGGSVGEVLVTGAGSVVNIDGFAVTPYVRVGDAGTGKLTVTDSASMVIGGSLEVGDGASGSGGHGTMIISGGATVTTGADGPDSGQPGDAHVGSRQATGNLLVTGAGSRLDVGTFMTVADDGHGTLTIDQGGAVTTASAFDIAFYAGSVGTVTVQNSSTLSVGDFMDVGHGGTGTLTVKSGSTVLVTSSVYLAGGDPGGKGTAVVTDVGTSFLVHDYLSVGPWGTGTFTLKAGAKASTVNSANIGGGSNGQGSATVTDAGSELTIGTFLDVGGQQNSTLDVKNSGKVTVGASLTVGNQLGGTGTVTVAGATSKLSVGSYLQVGGEGTGTLNIKDGTDMTVADAYIVGAWAGGTGTVNLTGKGAKLEIASWTQVGASGAGTMNVAAETSAIFSGDFSVGEWVGGQGTVNLNGGTITTKNGNNETIGVNGQGTFNQANGSTNTIDGSLFIGSANTGTVSTFTAKGTTTITIKNNMDIGVYAGSNGLFSFIADKTPTGDTVTGTLTLAPADGSTDLIVGDAGTGEFDQDAGKVVLNIAADPPADSTVLDIGAQATGNGTYKLTSGTLTAAGKVIIGDQGTGTFTATGGTTTVNGSTITVGAAAGAVGNLTLTGAGTALNFAGTLKIGDQGTGTLTLTQAKFKSQTDIDLAIAPGAVGNVNLNGEAGWTVSGNLTIGKGGNSTVKVFTGSSLDDSAGNTTLGAVGDASGELILSGLNTTFKTKKLTVGDTGKGTITVIGGAKLTTKSDVVMAEEETSFAELKINDTTSGMTVGGNLTIGDNGIASIDTKAKITVSGLEIVLGTEASGDGTLTLEGTKGALGFLGRMVIGSGGHGHVMMETGSANLMNEVVLGLGAIGTGELTIDGASSKLRTVHLIVGDGGQGTVTVSNTAKLITNEDATIGTQAGAPGDSSVTIDTKANWTIAGDLTIGDAGIGSLTVQGGGVVDNSAGSTTLGSQAGSSGMLTVSGTGSSFKTTGMIVGDAGDGAVDVSGGGKVTAKTAVTVGKTDGSSSEVTIGDMTSSLSMGSDLTIGDAGAGSLDNKGKLSVSGGNIVLGAQSTGIGSLTLDGAKSSLTFKGMIVVGSAGIGAMLMKNGTGISVNTITLGSLAGSIGQLTLDGTDTRATSAHLAVGSAGTGVLAASHSAKLTSTGDVTIGDQASASGSSATFDTKAAWTVSGNLTVANHGNASLSVQGGAIVTAASAGTTTLGNLAGSSAMLTANGTGSSFTTGTLLIGSAGNGTMTVSGGAKVAAKSNVDIGKTNGSSSSVTIGDATSSLSVGGTLTVGDAGTGSLDNKGKISVTGSNIVIGAQSTGQGSLTLEGAKSSLAFTGKIAVGSNGTATMLMKAGAGITVGTVTVGDLAGSTGQLTLDGAGTKATSAHLTVGEAGNGTLAVKNSAKLTSAGDVTIGDQTSASGSSATIDTKATWTVSGNLTVGNHGTASLAVQGGASVDDHAGTATFGSLAGSSSTLTVTGANTAFKTGTLVLGDSGDSTATISGSAKVTTTSDVTAGKSNGSTSNVTVDGPTSTLTAGGKLTIGDGGTAAFDNKGKLAVTGNSIVLGAQSTGNGSLTFEGAKSTLSFTGDLTDGQAGIGTMTVKLGAIIKANNLTLGGLAGSTGQLIVDTANSTMHSAKLTVGQGGQGTLTASHSAKLITDSDAIIADQAGAAGSSVTIDGKAVWTIGGNLTVGKSSAADLTVSGGASVQVGTSHTVDIADGTATVTGAGSILKTGSLTLGAVTLTVGNGGKLTVASHVTMAAGSTVDVTDPGSLVIGGGSGSAGNVTINAGGELDGAGAIIGNLVDNGTVDVSGGTLALHGGALSGLGTLVIESSGALDLSQAVDENTIASFDDSGSLALGSDDLLVTTEYTNSNWGSGNSFDAHAGVSGSGHINGQNVDLKLTGGDVTRAGSGYVLHLHAIGGGLEQASFALENDGTGASLTAALQTLGLTAAMSGLVDGNVTLGAGQTSADYTVTFDPNAGSLAGQAISILSNFDNIAPITVTFTQPGDAPVAYADSYIAFPGQDLSMTAADGVLANDVDPDNPLSAVLVNDVSNGSLVLNADGSFDYTPNAGFLGDDQFSYDAQDSGIISNTVTVTIHVTNVLYGTDGNDTLLGGAGAETMIGGKGDDTYLVNDLGDVVIENTGQGNDTIETTINNYALGENSNVENLTLLGVAHGVGNSGDNVITGNDLDNNLGGLAGADTLDGGAGVDRASYVSSPAAVDVSLATGEAHGGDAEGDVLISIEAITGSAFNDTLEGDGGNNLLWGYSGIDTVSYEHAAAGVTVALNIATPQNTGGAGIDTLSGFSNVIGSAFDDKLTGGQTANSFIGGAGADTINGGDGIDTASYASSPAGVNVSLVPGIVGQGGDAEGDHLTGIEDLIGSVFDDTLEGSAGANVLTGGGGVDTVSYQHATKAVTVSLAQLTAQNTGGAGSDTLSGFANLTGSAFNDELTGDAGDNLLTGGAGADLLNGGGGNDTASYKLSAAAVNVSLATGKGLGGDAQGETLVGISNLIGSAFNDVLIGDGQSNLLIGGDGNDTLNGGGGDDTLEGGAGDDTLNGGGGIDTLSYQNAAAGVTINLSIGTAQDTGGADIDRISGFWNVTGSAFADMLTGNQVSNLLVGGDGDDTLNGGGGNDTLEGGSGNNTFVFGIGLGNDVIGDFKLGQDVVELSHSVFSDVTKLASAISDDGLGNAQLVINGANSITFLGVSPDDLQQQVDSIHIV